MQQDASREQPHGYANDVIALGQRVLLHKQANGDKDAGCGNKMCAETKE